MQELNSMQDGSHWEAAGRSWTEPVMVRRGRAGELQYVRKHVVYLKAPVRQCLDHTSWAPVKTGWADTNIGTSDSLNIRSRLVAKEYNHKPIPPWSPCFTEIVCHQPVCLHDAPLFFFRHYTFWTESVLFDCCITKTIAHVSRRCVLWCPPCVL